MTFNFEQTRWDSSTMDGTTLGLPGTEMAEGSIITITTFNIFIQICRMSRVMWMYQWEKSMGRWVTFKSFDILQLCFHQCQKGAPARKIDCGSEQIRPREYVWTGNHLQVISLSVLRSLSPSPVQIRCPLSTHTLN